jgi:peptidoglycan hydrolase CwlO-like protein
MVIRRNTVANTNNGVDHVNDLKMRTSQMEGRVEHIDQQVGKIWSTLSETRQEMAAVSAEMRGVVAALQGLAAKMDKPPQQFNWGWLIAALSLVLAMATTFTNMNIAPLTKQLDRVTERQSNTLENGLKEKQDYSYQIGQMRAQIDREIEENQEDDVTDGAIMQKLYEMQLRLGIIEGGEGRVAR